MLYDKDIREPLFDFLEERYDKIRIFEEKRISKSRADVMVVTEDTLIGIEIKSDADTYARLERQVKDYNRYFDYNMIVVGSSHAAHIEDHIPDYWYIITVDEDGDKPDFYMLREGFLNPKREKKVKFRNQMSFLWRNELLHIQQKYGLPKYVNYSKLKISEKLMEKIPEEELKRCLCEELFERDYSIYEEGK